jgi:hypothetical protein
MAENDGRDIIIVSDLHLSTGYNRRTGTYSRREDFFYDAAFARFLDYLRGRDASGDRLRLVILGDLFDFLQVDPAGPHKTPQDLDRSDTMTRARMDTILQGHPLFFQALGRFVATGIPLEVVPGNHDIEMIRASTQQYFKQLLAQAAGDPKAAEGVTVYPWIYYVPGLLYAEHGQQYDKINSFATVLQPYEPREPLDPDAIDQPLGSYFVEYLFNRVEDVDPFADNIKPPTRYLAWAPTHSSDRRTEHVRCPCRPVRQGPRPHEQADERAKGRARRTLSRHGRAAVQCDPGVASRDGCRHR